MKLFVGFPAYHRQIDVEILSSVLQQEGDIEYLFDFIGTPIITDARNYLVRRFLESDREWLYFWDADIVIRNESQLFLKLVETSKNLDAAIVGAAYSIKNNDGLVVGGFLGEDGLIHNLKDDDVTEPLLVDAVGTGTMLIRRDVFEKMPAPWFIFDPKPEWVIPEDYYFCTEAKKYGFKTALDPRIQTWHYGQNAWVHLPPKKEETSTPP